jgi:histidinol dehydrogenase
MIPIRTQGQDEVWINQLLARSQFDLDDVNRTVKRIIDDVKTRGDDALKEYTQTYDRIAIDTFRVPSTAIEAAWRRIDPNLITYLQTAKSNIEAYHSLQQIQSFQIKKPDGTIIEQIVRPLQSVGIYVPGGTAAYPSTVLMNAIPAKIAGVPRIIMITPPSPNGLSDAILVAAKIAGVDEIYTLGGAQGIAALAYGTNQIPQVDKIVGPGISTWPWRRKWFRAMSGSI